MHRPESAPAQATAPRLLRGYAQDWAQYRPDEPFPTTVEDLPKRYRLVDVDHDGLGFSVTNEDERPDNPPIHIYLSDAADGSNKPGFDSYLVWCATAVAGTAHGSWFHTELSPAETARVDAQAHAPFPTLSPRTRRIADNLWALADITPEGASEYRYLAYSDHDALTRWRN